MDSAVARTLPSTPHPFEDGLGLRRLSFSVNNEPLELLAIREELTSVSSFEFALRDRVSRLSSFQSEHYARVRAVERVGKTGAALAVVSDHVAGARLSQILEFAESRLLPIETDAALCLIRQLVHAVTLLHKKAPDVCHGAIGPERLVITSQGRLVIVEHVLGAALDQLHYSHDQYWKSLRIPLPRTGSGPHFDRRSDITQVGMTALALIVGRSIAEDDYPSRISEMIGGTFTLSASGVMEPLPPPLREWLTRAIQLDPRNPFPSALEAWAELDRVLHYSDPLGEVAALKSFMVRYHARLAAEGPANASSAPPRLTPVAPASVTTAPPAVRPTAAPLMSSPALPVAPTPPAPSVAAIPPALSVAPKPPASSAAPASGPRPSVAPDSPRQVAAGSGTVTHPAPLAQGFAAPKPEPPALPAEKPPAQDLHTPMDDPIEEEEAETVMDKKPMIRGRWVAAAVLLIAVTTGGTLAARRFLVPAAEPAGLGSLAVQTNPPGATVVIDGQQRGVTPLSLSLTPGRHVVEIVTDGDVRSIPVTITPGGQVSQFIDIPRVASALGELQIRTEPAGAQVSVDGRPLGKTPLTAEGLTPGPHTVVLENELGQVTQRVTIEAGTTASLMVPMSAPRNAPLSGWIAVNAPVDVQLFENDRLLGTSQTDRIMVSVGRHDLEFVNDAIGFRASRTVNVSPGQVATIKLEMPKTTMALNAVPWAEVWVDGARVGETPIGSVPVSIGPHEVVFRHPELGERRVVTTVMHGTPAKVSIDMRKN